VTEPRPVTIEVRTRGPLLVGGQSAPLHGGDKATARDALDRPTIPASALRGALRIELERLLRGRDGEDSVCGANEEPQEAIAAPCPCPVCRLFGQEGFGIGTLRLEDAALAEDVPVETTLRSQVGVGRRSGSAVSGHLAFLEASAAVSDRPPVYRAKARLVARGPDNGNEDLETDLVHLRAACRALAALGGGKARGLGQVECRLVEETPNAAPAPPPPFMAGQSTVDVRLHFEARAPLHFGDGRPLGGFLPTRSSAPGSTVRGALAFALLEGGFCEPSDTRFQTLVAPAPSAPTFGSARVAGDRPSSTRRRCRPAEHVFDDLVGELLRREAASHGIALAPGAGGACPHPGCSATKVQPWPWREGHPELWRRVRTRTAINRRTGTSMDRKLFSVEVIEPWTLAEEDAQAHERLELIAELRGLTEETAELLARLHGREIWLGGRRSRGMGRCGVSIERAEPGDLAAVRARIDELTRTVADAWDAVRKAAGRDIEPIVGESQRLMAMVLDEPWAPEDESMGLRLGPLASDGYGSSDLEPVHRFVGQVEEGRFGAVEAGRYGAGDETPRGELEPTLAAAPGSVYVYTLDHARLDTELEAWVEKGRRGTGLHREMGWGRFTIRGAALTD
jgi:CRISPR/Cas system CSM-associated protein Csm3 (group 7 of RAMP superfamily)